IPLMLTLGFTSGCNTASRPTSSATASPAWHSVRSNVVVSPLSASRKVTATTAPVSRSTACSALCARWVRPSFIFVTRASLSVGLIHSLFEARPSIPPHDRAQGRRGLQRRRIYAHPLALQQPAIRQQAQHPAEYLLMRLQIDQPPRPRDRRVIRSLLRNPDAYKL